MHIVAIGWMFVVILMAAAEATSPAGTVLGAFFTLLLYGVMPLGIVLYILGTPGRKAARRAAEAHAQAQMQAQARTPAASAPADAAKAAAAASGAAQRDAGSQPAGAGLAAERKEP